MTTHVLRDYGVGNLTTRHAGLSLLDGAAAPPLVGSPQGVRLFKGLLVAVAMEAVAALGIAGLWQLWHLAR